MNSEIKIAICDPDVYWNNKIEKYIQIGIQVFHPFYFPEIQKYNSTEKLLSDLKEGKQFDLYYLEVLPSGIDGMQIAIQAKKQNCWSIIIFITEYMEYVPDAFRIHAYQYLYKPIDSELFGQEFLRALHRYHRIHFVYSIRTFCKSDPEKFEIFLKPTQILYFESDNKHIIVYFHENAEHYHPYTFAGRLSEITTIFEDYHFVRCHQSYLINMLHFREKGKDKLVFARTNLEIPISYTYKKDVKKKFLFYYENEFLKEI